MKKHIKVNYKIYGTIAVVKKVLKRLDKAGKPISFDLETRSIYDKATREEAKNYESEALSIQEQNTLALVSKSSGLSHPSIVKVTHMIIGVDLEDSIIIIPDDKLEKLVFDWLAETDLKVLIHNASFDLKIMYHRVGKFPKDFEDTQQLAKSLINDCNTYRSKTGLKVLVGSEYVPKWSMKEETNYEVKDLKNKAFLEYCAIDGSAVHLLWNNLKESIDETD